MTAGSLRVSSMSTKHQPIVSQVDVDCTIGRSMLADPKGRKQRLRIHGANFRRLFPIRDEDDSVLD